MIGLVHPPDADAAALRDHVRSTLEKVLGSHATATGVTDSVLEQLDGALASAGVDPARLATCAAGGGIAVMSLDAGVVDTRLVVMKPSVIVGVRSVPPR